MTIEEILAWESKNVEFKENLPEKSIRELIINAMVHRSYLDHGTIQVAVYDNQHRVRHRPPERGKWKSHQRFHGPPVPAERRLGRAGNAPAQNQPGLFPQPGGSPGAGTHPQGGQCGALLNIKGPAGKEPAKNFSPGLTSPGQTHTIEPIKGSKGRTADPERCAAWQRQHGGNARCHVFA